jgi:L-alanine-DL-glutamate epimerase-like enolase superfamily enzyme
MKISAIHIYQHDLDIKGKPYKMAMSAVASLDTTIVEIVSDSGISGFGEVCPLGPVYQEAHALGARAALCELAPHLIGMNPLHYGNVMHRCNLALMGHNYAKAAIDMALWDLLGKHYNAPISALLGGAKREKVPSYYAISIDSPDEVARMVIEKEAQGFGALQIKIGGRSVQEDIALARKVFEVKNPSTTIALDANRALTTTQAIQLSQSCRNLDFVLEQPCDSYQELKAIKANLCHPLYLDESAKDLSSIVQAIAEGVADGFGMKMTRVGGIGAMRSIIDICQAQFKPLSCDDSWGGDLVAAACVHLASIVELNLSRGAWIAAPYIDESYDSKNSVQISEGWIDVPKGPGLGVVPDTHMFTLCYSFS